jgi:anaerobic ribonucleoside-triphosphate reductase
MCLPEWVSRRLLPISRWICSLGYLQGSPVIIGGEPQDKTYGDFQAEIDMVNKAFLEVMIEGDAKGRVFTFPIPTLISQKT